jgi:hypothetical protein
MPNFWKKIKVGILFFGHDKIVFDLLTSIVLREVLTPFKPGLRYEK